MQHIINSTKTNKNETSQYIMHNHIMNMGIDSLLSNKNYNNTTSA